MRRGSGQRSTAGRSAVTERVRCAGCGHWLVPADDRGHWQHEPAVYAEFAHRKDWTPHAAQPVSDTPLPSRLALSQAGFPVAPDLRMGAEF